MDWNLLEKTVDYYKRCGGSVDDRLSAFMDGRLAAYYDDLAEKIGEERCMPLLRFYLGRGIDGRSDLKALESIFTFLIDLTENPYSAISFKGDRTIKRILLEGEQNKMAKKYNNEWYLKSIDSVVGSIEKNAAYLNSIKGKGPEARDEDVTALFAKYQELRDRVLALKEACPESHLSIVDELAKLQILVKNERRKLLINDFYAALHSTTKDNVFIQADGMLKRAEEALAKPPKGASIPSDSQIVGKMITGEGHTNLDDAIHVTEYRGQCLELFNAIQSSITSREANVKQLEEGVLAAEARGRDISRKRQELKRKYENGQISDAQLEREGTMLKMQLDSAVSVYNRKKMYYDALSTKFLRLYEAWESFRTSLEIVVENNSEDAKLIDHYDNIVEALRRFAGFINGIEDDDNFDFSLYQKLVSDVQAELKREIEEVAIITGANVDPLNPLVESKPNAGKSFILDDDNDPFAVHTTTNRPATGDGEGGDPAVIIEGDPNESQNPFRSILDKYEDD